jgi:hypothetical protein
VRKKTEKSEESERKPRTQKDDFVTVLVGTIEWAVATGEDMKARELVLEEEEEAE